MNLRCIGIDYVLGLCSGWGLAVGRKAVLPAAVCRRWSLLEEREVIFSLRAAEYMWGSLPCGVGWNRWREGERRVRQTAAGCNRWRRDFFTVPFNFYSHFEFKLILVLLIHILIKSSFRAFWRFGLCNLRIGRGESFSMFWPSRKYPEYESGPFSKLWNFFTMLLQSSERWDGVFLQCQLFHLHPTAFALLNHITALGSALHSSHTLFRYLPWIRIV